MSAVGSSYNKTITHAFNNKGTEQRSERGPWLFKCKVTEVEDENDFVFDLHMSFKYGVHECWTNGRKIRISVADINAEVNSNEATKNLEGEARAKACSDVYHRKLQEHHDEAISMMETGWAKRDQWTNKIEREEEQERQDQARWNAEQEEMERADEDFWSEDHSLGPDHGG